MAPSVLFIEAIKLRPSRSWPCIEFEVPGNRVNVATHYIKYKIVFVYDIHF